MSEVTDIVVPMLQRVQAQLTGLDERSASLKEDMHNIKVRMSSMEENQAALNRHVDNFGFRLDRIERRLDLIEA